MRVALKLNRLTHSLHDYAFVNIDQASQVAAYRARITYISFQAFASPDVRT
jgi:hypothetical protein